MTIKTTKGKTTITIGAHTKTDIEAAAQMAADLWSQGEWAEVCTMLGDPVFWITPNGTEHWDNVKGDDKAEHIADIRQRLLHLHTSGGASPFQEGKPHKAKIDALRMLGGRKGHNRARD